MAAIARAGRLATVIGASGFVGSHVVDMLLSQGWAVRGAMRDVAGAKWVQDLAKEGAGPVELCKLELTANADNDADLDAALQGTDAAFFCTGFETQSPETIKFMVNNAVAVLRAARRQKVGCVVLTSSGGSTNPPGHSNETPKNEIDHWSDPEKQQANGRFSPAAKTLMEINALKEVGRNQKNEIVDEEAAKDAPRLCIMNPNLILGPQLNPGPISGNSLPWILAILKGESMTEAIPNDSMSIIDVRDLAALHVACAEMPVACGRYFGVNRSWPWEEILAAFHDAYPEYKVPPRFQGEAATPTQFDHTRKESLGVKLRTLSETVKDLVSFYQTRGVLP